MFALLFTDKKRVKQAIKPAAFLLICSFGLLFLTTGRSLALDEAQIEDARLENAVKEQFFTSLDEARMVELLEQIDSEQDYSPNELGAKYRWGYIPPDRRIPDRLGEWWRGLSRSERRRHRVSWFRRYYQRLDVDQAANRLNLSDRLYQIQRRIEADWYRRDIELEDIEFDIDEDADEEVKEEVDQPAPEPEEPVSDETAEKPEPEPEKEDKPSEDPEEPADTSEPEEEAVAAEDEEADDPDPSPEEAPEPEEERSPFIYRRVGDEVEVIRREDEETRREDREVILEDPGPAEEPPEDEDEKPVILDIPLPPVELSR